jgi:hypothetical protein
MSCPTLTKKKPVERSDFAPSWSTSARFQLTVANAFRIPIRPADRKNDQFGKLGVELLRTFYTNRFLDLRIGFEVDAYKTI